MDQQPHTPPVAPDEPNDDLPAMLGRGGRGRRSPLTMVLAAVVLVAIGFIAGIVVGKGMGDSPQQAALPGLGQDGPTFGNGNPGAPNAGDGMFTFGTIQRIDGDTITLQAADGSTVTVKVGDDTQIQFTEDGDLGDLAEGSSIAVTGTKDGNTVEASSINEGGGFAVGDLGMPAG
jgi:hypothetical protein